MRRVQRNTYRISVEPNQAGRFEARIEARYAESNWALRVYFLAATAERLLSHLQATLRYLQRHEEELWMWGANPADRGLFFEDLLGATSLELDRRREFPRGALVIAAEPGELFRPLQLAELKRRLAGRLAPAPRVAPRAGEALRSSA
ncbi:MAG: hypothetical protein A3D93_02585 [Acidobacteria bacterium RIFCSPHIGHO2_12_FULL_67_30]|nr:MAG: hypothetical protein A3B65_04620 [Acidobacteria bacterium RIFCSPHIGHO2_02_FULL_67_57]OFV86281.1 MAG: hypothetical protein A2620_05350 [Acidobacteria bacterium RIFCSPHIGHO2_01_FULL_67_28]OFV86770.1 MAG: hypothetical protein A3D93_02585 [Acidobacteria bacterium RIFCSPHIGHO2_12_FULL_67_30]